MRRTTLVVAAIVATIGAVGAGPAAADDDLSFFEMRKVVSEAREAMEAERFDTALALYERILAATDESDGKHEEALYHIGLIRLSTDPRLRDLEAARARLARFEAAYPKSDRRTEARLLLTILRDLESHDEEATTARDTVEEARRTVAGLRADLEQCREERADQTASTSSKDAALASARAETRRLRAEVERLGAELEQKEAALAKVTAMVTGKSSP